MVAKVDIQPVEWVEKKVNVRIAQMPTSLRFKEKKVATLVFVVVVVGKRGWPLLVRNLILVKYLAFLFLLV